MRKDEGSFDTGSKFGETCYWCRAFLPGITVKSEARRRIHYRGKYFCPPNKWHPSCLQRFLDRGFDLPEEKVVGA